MAGSAVLAWLVVAQLAPPNAAAMPQPLNLGPPDLFASRADPMASDSMRSDAELADVCFVDSQRGWAVGDRGAIWHTDDGGNHWHLQPSGVGCPLQSVCFIDPKTGWAAGGRCRPYTHLSTGLLLVTRDGGRHWRQRSKLLLPTLKRVGFFDEKHGWAVGCPSKMFPSGVFTTADGGLSWTPLHGPSIAAWLAGDFLNPHTGALAGRQGTAAVVRRGGVEPARMGSFGLRSLTNMQLLAPVHGWLVGDGGLVLLTSDLGSSWQTPPAELPDGAARHFDFTALAVRGTKCWIAGSPGTRVFHSPDAGHTWHAFATGTPLPIHALCFVDDQHGWAAGALGSILATRDGGRTWRLQRAGGTRAALLGLCSQGTSVPFELFAQLCGNEGYLGVVEVLNRRDVESPPRDRVHPADRLHEAVVGVGACGARTAWRFPLRQSGLRLDAERIIEAWDRVNDARGLAELQSHVVRQIRLWRPEVIVTHDAGSGDDPLGQLIRRTVLEGVRQAADPTSFSQQITHAGLEPWQVKRVYGLLPPGRDGPIRVTTAQLAVRLGRSLADVAAKPRGLIDDEYAVPPPVLGFRLLSSRSSAGRQPEGFFSGLALFPGGEARRELLQPPAETLALLRRTAQQRRNAQAIIEQSEKAPQPDSRLLAQTADLVRGLDERSAGRILYQLGQQYYRTGRWTMAAETFELLADRHPRHPLAAPAVLWLIQYYASGEAAWRVQGPQRCAVGQALPVPTEASPKEHPYAVRQASALSIDASRQEGRADRAAELGSRIERTRPLLFAEPALRFPLAVAHRNQGFPRQAERYFLACIHGPDRDAWWACARGERWLAEPSGLPPKSVLRCVVAASKPRLDGRLDEAVWQRARPAALRSAHHEDGQWPAAVMLAYDAEFLYLAVECRRAPGAAYEAAQGPRTRDPDLSAHDRVDVLLDLDRDFATYYRLTVDLHGQPGEGCWGDHTWDPTWFVAAHAADDAWTVEAAVALDQLTGSYPASRSVWALGIQRTVPGVGFQSWTTPAATRVIPEGFGYLIFE